MESGLLGWRLDLAAVGGGDPVAPDFSTLRAGPRVSRASSGGIWRGLALAAGVAAIMTAGGSFASAAGGDAADEAFARVQVLEREIAAIKRENEALRQVKKLREENTALVRRQPAASPDVGHSQERLLAARDPREAYAADAPLYLKAAAPVDRGTFTAWAEGGAIWTGGDPILSPYLQATALINPSQLFFRLRPAVGWEAATGFDYRVAGSPWHVSGQVRYGEGRTSATATSTTVLTGTPPDTFTLINAAQATDRESRWLADIAVGRDVFGTGPDAMQFKFGVRVAEFRTTTTAFNNQAFIFATTAVNGSIISATGAPQESRFFGAGPRFGVEGSVPLGHNWAFDYLGDVAALFGTQKFEQTTSLSGVSTIPGISSTSSQTFAADQSFATVFNSDIQAGVSYWMTPSMKISASYRLDAYFNALKGLDIKNDPTKLQTIDRYTHGPRLAVTAQF